MTDENSQSKGFGFVHFETQEAADSAINKVNGMLLADKKVFVGRFTPRNQRSDGSGQRKFTNIFVKNFGDQIDEEQLRELLSKYGKITSFKVRPISCEHSNATLFPRRSKTTKMANRKGSAFAVSKVPKKPKRFVDVDSVDFNLAVVLLLLLVGSGRSERTHARRQATLRGSIPEEERTSIGNQTQEGHATSGTHDQISGCESIHQKLGRCHRRRTIEEGVLEIRHDHQCSGTADPVSLGTDSS